MKLKTLNDCSEKTTSQKILKMEIKQEAIKWVKDRREDCINSINEQDFMEFHDITEEDLKWDVKRRNRQSSRKGYVYFWQKWSLLMFFMWTIFVYALGCSAVILNCICGGYCPK